MMQTVKRVVPSFYRQLVILAIVCSLVIVALIAGPTSEARDRKASAVGKNTRVTKTASSPTSSNEVTVPAALLQQEPSPTPTPAFQKTQVIKDQSEAALATFDYADFVEKEKRGEIPQQRGPALSSVGSDKLVNDNSGSTGTALFTQSETSLVAFGDTVVIGFVDSGSNSGGTNKFTGFSRSTDGGNTFTDGGTLPTNQGGDAGEPVLARDNSTGRIFFSTAHFSSPVGATQVFHSDDNGATWSAPVNGTPGGSNEDSAWIAVDNFAGGGNGNVYLMSRRFGNPDPGIYMYRSTDGGLTFGPSGGTSIVSGMQGSYVAVGPDHSVYAFWFAGTTIQVRKSTDLGVTFGAPVTVTSGISGGINGDLNLTGIRQGTSTPFFFRTNAFPHAAINPVSGHLYVVYNNNPAGVDKADVFFVMSTDGGNTWSAPARVNDDATTTDQWHPTLAVTPDGTHIGFFYYSRQEDVVSNNLFKYYARLGTISGSTVTLDQSIAVSDLASFPEFGRDSAVTPIYMGEYDQAVATPGAFHVTWSDSRDDLPGGAPRKDPNVYYKKIGAGLHVSTTVPAVNSVVSTQPTSFTINVSEPVNAATLSASDFTVNGIAADSLTYVPGSTTMNFSYGVSPVTAQGLQNMHITSGAFTSSAADDPVNEFDGPFRYDTATLQVISTTPSFPNGTFNLPGPFTYQVNFNEPVDPSSVQTADLTLTGIPGSSVTSASVLPGNMIVEFTINASVEGALTASIAGGAITDAFGNAGLPFSAVYPVDIDTVAYPTPLVAKEPHGSLIYDPSISGIISFAGDTDNFTLPVDPSQTITVLVSTDSASLQPSIALRDPASTVIGSGTAAAAGQPALLQSVPTTTGGTYTMTVGGAANTTGNYTVRVILNAAEELEGTIAGVTNSTRATAQDINGSFITLQTSLGSAQRGAVDGNADNTNYSASAVAFGFEDISGTGTVVDGVENQDDTAVTVPIGFTFPFYGTNQTNVGISSNGLLTFPVGYAIFTNADLTGDPGLATIAPFWDDLHTGGGAPNSHVYVQTIGAGPNQHLTIQWNQIRFFTGGTGDPITFQAQLYADGRIQFNYLDLVSDTNAANNGGSATVGVKASGVQGPDRRLLAFNNGPNAFVGTGQSTLLSPPTPTSDFYSFSLAPGDVTTLAVKAQSAATMTLELQDAGGNVLASGAPTLNVARVINNFVAVSGGTYYARIAGSTSAPYELIVTRNAAFDTEENNTFATAQPIDGNRGALGGTDGANEDWYSITVSAGNAIQLETSTPADGPGEFVNALNPHIELYDPAAVLVASGVPLADGRNESINYSALASGTYRVRVLSEDSTTGEYFLSTGAAATPPVVAGAGTLVEESCPPTNGAADPGERVSVLLQVTNMTANPIGNVVGTLQSSGGVLAPDGPQDYGTIGAGSTVARQFAFTVDPSIASGGTITASLQLQSGATNLGIVTYSFVAGPTPCGGVKLVVTSTLVRTSPSNVQANISIQNIGTLAANATTLAAAKLGSTTGTPLPINFGNIAPNAIVNSTVNFTNSTPGAASTLVVGGTHTGGNFSSTKRVTIP